MELDSDLNIQRNHLEKLIRIYRNWAIFFAALTAIPFIVAAIYNFSSPSYLSMEETGSYIGGFSAPFASLSGILFVYVAFLGQRLQIIYQQQDLRTNQKELQDTREELRGQKEQLELQNKQFALQSFEGTFFKLLEYYRIERDNIEGLFNAKGKYAIKDIMTVRLNHQIPDSDTDLPTSGLPYFHSLFNKHRISLSEYLRAFHILLTFIEEHQRYNYLQFLSAYMDEHEKVFHAYYYGTIGLPTQRDLVAEFGFLRDVERFVFNFPDDYHTILNIPPPEEVDWSESTGDII